MNIIDGLTAFKKRMKLNNKQLAQIMKCSDSAVSLYLSGDSGMSLEKLALLLKNGMSLEEAFGADVAEAIVANLHRNGGAEADPLSIVADGLQQILDIVKKRIETERKANGFLNETELEANENQTLL